LDGVPSVKLAGIPGALLIGAGGLLVAGFIMHRLKLPAGDVDMVPSNHWPEPLVAEPVAHDRGPVLILIEYHVEKHHRTAFLHALNEMSQERRRDGAYGWGVTEDSADPKRSSNGSWSNPGPSIFASISGFQMQMLTYKARSSPITQEPTSRSCGIS
jgi:hypothetical protein